MIGQVEVLVAAIAGVLSGHGDCGAHFEVTKVSAFSAKTLERKG
jgi:hypothetical protein